MQYLQHYSLEYNNTLSLPSIAQYYGKVTSLAELKQAITFAKQQGLPIIPLGGGSNVVLDEYLNAVVLSIALTGKHIDEKEACFYVTAQAGENWHKFVQWTIEQGCNGLENLSLIPGAVGAAPIQNIGAYGVEIKDYFVSLEAFNIATGEVEVFDRQQCEFGYRDSVFKRQLKDQYIITSVTFALDKVLQPKLSYGLLSEALATRLSGKAATAANISAAVCDIRQQKLPDPKILANAGSFFKNPEVDHTTMDRLRAEFPDIVAFATTTGWKLAAGWLIEQAGLKGVQHGTVGTYQYQALVLVNYGTATATDIRQFAAKVQQTVWHKFGVMLEIEPRFY